MVLPLREDQIQDLACVLRDKRFGILSDPGTGKTPVVNMLAYFLWHRFQQKTVFVMPLSLQSQNRKSFFKFTPFKPEDIVIVRGTLKQRQKLMADPVGKVFIVGFDFFKPYVTKKAQREADWEFLYRYHPSINCCSVDEIHEGFGSIKSARTKWWIHSMKQMEYFAPMTGTAIDGRLDTIYPMVHVIEPRYYFNYNAFINEHAVVDFWGSIEGWTRTDKVRKILEKHAVRRTFESVHGKDNILLETEEIEMTGRQKQMYDEFEADHMIELDHAFLEADSGGVVAIRLRQIMQCPNVIDPEFKGSTAKEDRLESHILRAYQANKQIVVFSSFHAEQDRIQKIFDKHKIPAGIINGKKTPAQCDQADEDFRSGKLFGIIASPKKVAVGYDWEFVDYMVFHSLDYKDSNFTQGYRRAIRGAREHPLLCYLLQYEDSRDQQIASIVETKMALASEVQDGKQVFQLNKRKAPNTTTPPDRSVGKKLTMNQM